MVFVTALHRKQNKNWKTKNPEQIQDYVVIMKNFVLWHEVLWDDFRETKKLRKVLR